MVAEEEGLEKELKKEHEEASLWGIYFFNAAQVHHEKYIKNNEIDSLGCVRCDWSNVSELDQILLFVLIDFAKKMVIFR